MGTITDTMQTTGDYIRELATYAIREVKWFDHSNVWMEWAIPSWGAHGWDSFDWPYSAIGLNGATVRTYYEGDYRQVTFADTDTAARYADALVLDSWQWRDQSFNYQGVRYDAREFTPETMPEWLRGPYTFKRGETS